MNQEFLWVEKYRPKSIEECILPESIKQSFQEFVGQNQIPNLLLSGTAGVGKTTVAKALCNELGADFIVINGSDEGRLIETLRVKIKNFASTVSLSNSPKVVILDEADYINADSVQPALRNFIEEFSNNCRFIFTCNYKNRIIAPLHSRCVNIDFKITNDDKPLLASQFMKRVENILGDEQVKFEPPVIAELIFKFFPDFRRVLNELQRYSVAGVIDSGVLSTLADEKLTPLISCIKEKRWGDMRKWVGQNSNQDFSVLFRKVFDALEKRLVPESIPAAVLVIADYQYKNAFSADAEINFVACMTELMTECKFKE